MSEQVHLIQAMFDGMSKQSEQDRALTQMTLGELIETLEGLESARAIRGLSSGLDSYRGYYSDLAIEPSDDGCNVGVLLSVCQQAMGAHFEGYKGGDYYMTANTPMWVDHYGVGAGNRLMGLDTEPDPIVPVIEKEVS